MAHPFDQRSSPPVTLSRGGLARVIIMALGVYLAISGFIWQQPLYGRLNCFTVGIAMIVVAVNDFWFARARFLNAALALWLAASTTSVFHATGPARWSAFVVAIAVFVISMLEPAVPTSPTGTRVP